MCNIIHFKEQYICLNNLLITTLKFKKMIIVLYTFMNMVIITVEQLRICNMSHNDLRFYIIIR